MKKTIILTLVFAFCGLFAMAQKGPVLEFEGGAVEMVLDYGKVKKSSEPFRTVKFKNTGDEPLIIKNARSTCGCTVPDWPKDPILPGEESSIKIRYATDRVGKINKKVTITTNDGKDYFIQLDGEVLNEEAKQESVPMKKPSMIEKGGL